MVANSRKTRECQEGSSEDEQSVKDFAFERFDGHRPDPSLWLATFTFATSSFADARRVRKFYGCLKGDAFEWWGSLLLRDPGATMTWDDTVSAFRTHFMPASYREAAVTELISLRMTGSVPQHVVHFSRLAKISQWDDLALKDLFLRSLPPRITSALPLRVKAESFLELAEWAQAAEARQGHKETIDNRPKVGPVSPVTSSQPAHAPTAPPASASSAQGSGGSAHLKGQPQ
jgi:hypothetical protein